MYVYTNIWGIYVYRCVDIGYGFYCVLFGYCTKIIGTFSKCLDCDWGWFSVIWIILWKCGQRKFGNLMQLQDTYIWRIWQMRLSFVKAHKLELILDKTGDKTTRSGRQIAPTIKAPTKDTIWFARNTHLRYTKHRYTRCTCVSFVSCGCRIENKKNRKPLQGAEAAAGSLKISLPSSRNCLN